MLQKLKERYRTFKMIRNAIDTYPDGICFAAADGRPILANKKINDVCCELTGHTITNAAEMWQTLSAGAISQSHEKLKEVESILLRRGDGTVWQFQKRPLQADRAQITQYEASDITELYEYQNRLAENNLQVTKLHERQRELLKNIVQNNLDKELLSAKMRIHDAFGRLLIITKKELTEGNAEQNERELFSAWENVIADMENAAVTTDVRESSPQKELIQVADLIGCRVEFQGKQPTERKALLLLYAAIREALTNAVKHAGADKLRVEISAREGWYDVEIQSNGRTASAPIQEGGGLGSLRKRLEQDGATMRYRYNGAVTLVLTIPKE